MRTWFPKLWLDAMPLPTPTRITSHIDRDSLMLAELREIKELLRMIKDRM